MGLYGVVAYTVAQRTHEIGIRLALGADGGRIVRMIVGQGLATTISGIGAGLVLSLASTRVLASLLFGVSPRDPVVISGHEPARTGREKPSSGDSDASRRGGVRAADCVRQRCEPVAGARLVSHARDRDSHRARRRTRPARSATPDRAYRARGRGRRTRTARRDVGR